jgi:hypothetical protein
VVGEEANRMSLTIDDVVKAAHEGFLTTVGLGALAYQQAQVRRQELKVQVPRLLHELGEAVDSRLTTLGERLCDADQRAEGLFDDIEQRLPAPVRSAARQVHGLARDVRTQVPALLGTTAGTTAGGMNGNTNHDDDHEVTDTA